MWRVLTPGSAPAFPRVDIGPGAAATAGCADCGSGRASPPPGEGPTNQRGPLYSQPVVPAAENPAAALMQPRPQAPV